MHDILSNEVLNDDPNRRTEENASASLYGYDNNDFNVKISSF